MKHQFYKNDFFIPSWDIKLLFLKINKINSTNHKHLLTGDYLIDDRPFNGASEFKGKWIYFGSDEFPDWKSILNFFSIKT